MDKWKKTFCPLCYHNCGLEVQAEGNRIRQVRRDKEHPRTKGYICRKGARVAYYQDHHERLTHPLKKKNGEFEKISWDQAFKEIAGILKKILLENGPRSIAYMGGGGQGCHLEASFGRGFLMALGSQYHYSPLAQELTGLYWINGRAYGRQNLHLGPDLDEARNFLVIGWNGYVSNAGVNRARERLEEFSKDQDKSLIVVDPLKSETARLADKHFRIRIGTAALFLKSLIAVILKKGLENKAYIERHCASFDDITKWFKDFDVASATRVCGIEQRDLEELARTYATQPTAIRSDLGILMDRQSTMNSYLEMILMAICGRIGTSGGNVFPGHVLPLGPHSDERNPATWRTVETGIPAIMGYFPPNVVPEEILSPKKDRLRAMIVSGSNPLRSYADTTAYERAFKQLELLVSIDISLSETARASHYVLPARSAFEKWDTTFFSLTFPEIYLQLRHPCCEPRGEPMEEGEIFLGLAEAMDLMPDIPAALHQASYEDRKRFADTLKEFLAQDRRASVMSSLVLAKTLGKRLNSAHLAALWGIMMNYPRYGGDELARAGYNLSPLLGDTLFRRLLVHPEGILIGKMDRDNNLDRVRTPDGKIHLHIGELEDWMGEIEPEEEKTRLERGDSPFVLVAGRHFPYNANTIMRDPHWNRCKEVCTVLISREDADELDLKDGEDVCVITEASRIVLPVEISTVAVKGVLVIPHGFGLLYQGEAYGANVNLLTKNTHRDRMTATPLHRFVPCRIERT